MMELYTRRDDEVKIFERHGADGRLAQIMSKLFGPLGYSPTKTLNERIQQARRALDFQYLAFDMLLKGETEQARQYMQRAAELDPKRAGNRQEIINNIHEVQKIITASRTDFDRRRVEKYGLKPFEDYLV